MEYWTQDLGENWIVIHKVSLSFYVFDVFKAQLLEMPNNKRMCLFSNENGTNTVQHCNWLEVYFPINNSF